MPVPSRRLKELIEGTVDHHASQHWPALEEVTISWRGSYGYLTGYLSEDDDDTIKLCRIQYLGDDHDWAFAIWQASTDSYTDSVLLSGRPVGHPSQALDTACTLYLADTADQPAEPLKELRGAALGSGVMASQYWEFREFPGPRPNGEDNAVVFLNDPDRQGRGEAAAALRGDGSVGLFYLAPGSLGAGTSPTWAVRDFPGPNGAKDAAIFLNVPDRQGRGEATATLRSDGTAGLLYLEPGSLGTTTTHTWEYGEFVGPKEAVDFLNEPARQGRGEATVTPRKNGTVGLLYLVPGSLGDSTAHTWYFKEFPAPHGVRDALAFLNAHPRQGEGEVSGYAHTDGSAVIFYLEPGSN